MAQYDLSGTKTDDFLECSIVESKVREKLFELGIKRVRIIETCIVNKYKHTMILLFNKINLIYQCINVNNI